MILFIGMSSSLSIWCGLSSVFLNITHVIKWPRVTFVSFLIYRSTREKLFAFRIKKFSLYLHKKLMLAFGRIYTHLNFYNITFIRDFYCTATNHKLNKQGSRGQWHLLRAPWLKKIYIYNTHYLFVLSLRIFLLSFVEILQTPIID